MKKLYWTGYSNKAMVSSISEIEDIILAYGFIIDFKRYSDISLSLIVEVAGWKIEKLHQNLSQYMRMSNLEITGEQSEKENLLFLNITFSGTGRIKFEVPNVPG